MEARDQEQGRILVIECFELIAVDIRRGVPRLASDPDEHENLDRGVDHNLTNNTGENLRGDKTGCRPFVVDFGVWQSPSHCILLSVKVAGREVLRHSLATAIGIMTKRSIYRNLKRVSLA